MINKISKLHGGKILNFKVEVDENCYSGEFEKPVGGDITMVVAIFEKMKEASIDANTVRSPNTVEDSRAAQGLETVIEIPSKASSVGEPKSFRDAITGEESKTNEDMVIPFRPLSTPRFEGGNLIVELDMEDYKKEVEELCFSIVGRNYLQKGKVAPPTMELKTKLPPFWD